MKKGISLNLQEKYRRNRETKDFLENFKKSYKKYLIILFLFTLTFAIYVFLRENRGEIMKVVFLDVGDGVATFIETPNGKKVLIDSGPDASVLRALSSVLPFYDHSLDFFVISNFSTNYAGGFKDVIEKYHVEKILISPRARKNSTKKSSHRLREAFDQTLVQNDLSFHQAVVGEKTILDEQQGIYFEILDMDEGLIIRLQYKKLSFLLMGNVSQKIERKLIENRNSSSKSSSLSRLKSDVLEVGHQGSHVSTSVEFVKAVSPSYAVISVGNKNRYGYPGKSTLLTLSRMKIKTFITAQNGSITFLSNGKNR